MKKQSIQMIVLSVPALALTGTLHSQVELITKMAANEKSAREQRSLFAYSSKERSPRTGGHLWGEMVVETKDGVLRRLIDIDGNPLTGQQSAVEDQRIQLILNDPSSFRRLNKSQEDDETHAITLLSLLPRAFILSPDGQQEGCTKVAFRPNPSFVPTSYEEKVIAVMAGTVSVKEPEDRLCKVEAEIAQPVEFGFGLLGRLNAGGRIALTRTHVSGANWKTSEMSVHVAGRVFLLKSLSREQDAVRHDIQVLDKPVSLTRAAQLIRP